MATQGVRLLHTPLCSLSPAAPRAKICTLTGRKLWGLRTTFGQNPALFQLQLAQDGFKLPKLF